ncbi:major royal jelly protein 1-like [Leptopilina heterotoma]|uniref:major royal jelly protein 1-like n=1 Tax=Leptopilina heterotoma TaxID=63436 RepID=UPI001CA9E813|nr:major royal jelly protein 1-like [Leptopilina heterotoma]
MLRQLVIFAVIFTVVQCHDSFRVTFQWKYINYTWPSTEVKERAITRFQYVPWNNAISGIKIWKEKIYLSIPRFKSGVPVTLAVTPAIPDTMEIYTHSGPARVNITDPKLEPFPSWEMQEIGDCDALQFVQGMEIDPLGRMWVLDSGRVDTMTLNPQSKCPPRLVILDLENNGEVLRSFEFPEDVANRQTVYLNDIVLDHEDGGYAYITDTSEQDPGIIVFSLKNNTSWKVRHQSMRAQREAIPFVIDRVQINRPFHVDGIALSPASVSERIVYYSPLSSFYLYSIPAAALRNRTDDINSYVKELGRKRSQSDGIAMSATGVLYFGLLADDAVSYWNTTQRANSNYQQSSFAIGQRIFTRDHALLQWPDTFAFDEKGQLWCVTNRLQMIISSMYNITADNFRIIKSNAMAKNYQYYEDGSAPVLPAIPAGVDRVGFSLATCLAVLLVFLMK